MARSSTMSGPVEGVTAAPALSRAMQGVCSSGDGWDRSITAGATGLPTPAQRDEQNLHALLQQLRPPCITRELIDRLRHCALSSVCTGSRPDFGHDAAAQIVSQLRHKAHAWMSHHAEALYHARSTEA